MNEPTFILPECVLSTGGERMQAEKKIKGYALCNVWRVPVWLSGVPLSLRQRKLIGDAVRLRRKRAGLTQEALAEKADLHPVYVGEIERGEQTVSVHALVKIARAVGARVRDLVAEL